MSKIVFMGTPDFAVPALEALIEHHNVVGVVTQPDRPAGRKKEPQPPPVKTIALQHGIPVFQPEKIRKPEAIEELQQFGDIDAYVVAAFGQILPQTVLDIPRHGSINIHGSLLPRWRGAAPIHAAIREGDDETGITIMLMDAGLDTGPMLSKRTTPIHPDDTAQTVHDRLAVLGAELLIDTLPRYFSGEISPQAQPDEGVTYAPQIKKEEGNINWNDSAEAIERMVRAFTPWPGTFTYWNGRMLKILSGHVESGALPVGRVAEWADEGIAIGTGSGVYVPEQVQIAGKKATSTEDFLRGYPDIIGATLSVV